MPLFNNDAILITRTSTTVGAGGSTSASVATIFNGMGDFQQDGQRISYEPSGVVDRSEAIIFVDPLADGSLPPVQADDDVTVNGAPYGLVVSAKLWPSPGKHLEIIVSRGPKTYEPER